VSTILNIVIIIIIVKRVQTSQPRLYVNTIRTRVCRRLQYILYYYYTIAYDDVYDNYNNSLKSWTGPCPKSLRFVCGSSGVRGVSSWENLPGKPISLPRTFFSALNFVSFDTCRRTENVHRSSFFFVDCLLHDFDSNVFSVQH